MPHDPHTDKDARVVSQPSLPDVNKPLRLYLDRLAPSSRLTMTYVLQDAADRLGMADVDIHDIPGIPCNLATLPRWSQRCVRMTTRPIPPRCM